MITNKGSELISKYLLGHTQSYATYMAIGCGAIPNTDSFSKYTTVSKTITAIDGSSSTVVLTLSQVHDFIVGDIVTVENCGAYFDGQFEITAKTDTTITYIAPWAYASVASIQFNTPVTDQATATTDYDHRLVVGDIITIAGTTYLSGDYTVLSVPSTTTFVVTDTSDLETGDETGTITFKFSGWAYGVVSKVASTFQAKRSLDFEMERFPISVRGLSVINNVTNLIFSADLPTQQRYGITEVGIFSGLSNPITFNSADSKNISLFTEAEPWQIHSTSSTTDVGVFTDAVGAGVNSDLAPALKAQDATFIQSSNSMFLYEGRVSALEQPRMYDSTLVVSGALTSSVNIDHANVATIPSVSVKHIHLITNTNLFDFSKNYVDDEIRVAFSILKANVAIDDLPNNTPDPTNATIKIVFTSESGTSPKSSMITISTTNGDIADFSQRYYVIKKKLSEFTQEAGFSWTSVDAVRIYVSIDEDSDYMVAFDGMRFENVFDETISPYYGMIAYSTTGTTFVPSGSATPYIVPISKNLNSQNRFEYAIPLKIQSEGFDA